MLNRVVEFSLTQRLLVAVVTLGLAVAGVLAFRALPIDAYPDVSSTQVKVIMKAPGMTPEEVEARAKEWMAAARENIAARKGVVAAARLNQVLSLPPNSHTEEAQALMGEARELSGEPNKAKLEYDLYLKQYPQGKFVAQVQKHLAELGKEVAPSAAAGPAPAPRPATWFTFTRILMCCLV